MDSFLNYQSFGQCFGSVLVWMRIRIQHCRSMRIRMPTKNRKFMVEKNIFFSFINHYLLIPRPPTRTYKLPMKPSTLKREHSALLNLKFLNFILFCGSFLSSWILIRIQRLKSMRIHEDPDPKKLVFIILTAQTRLKIQRMFGRYCRDKKPHSAHIEGA